MNTLLLIDGHSVAYRAFFALPVEKFQTSTGQHTNAVFGFMSMLLKLLRDEHPTHIAVVFDVSRHSFRTEEYENYKATRAKSPEEFHSQIELIKGLLEAMNIQHLELEGFEADDLIATLARRSENEDMTVWIVTGDRDALQLVDDRVTVLYTRKGVSELARMTPEAVEEKHLVAPKRYPELAALVGEKSDNLPGVPGVGPKTAAKWLAEYDGLDNLLAHAEQVRGKAGESLRAHLDDVRRNRRLNALVTNVELAVDTAELERRPWDRTLVDEMLVALEITAFRRRIDELDGGIDKAECDARFEIDGEVLAPGALSSWLAEYAVAGTGVDFIGRWGKGTGEVIALSIAAPCGKAAYVRTDAVTAQDDAALAAWLADSSRPKAIHDAKGPMVALAEHGWRVAGIVCDTMLAGYLLEPERRGQTLEDLSVRFLKQTLASHVEGTSEQLALDFGEVQDQDAKESMVRAAATLALADELDDRLEVLNQRRLLQDVEQPLMQVLATMERTGIAVDQERLGELRRNFDDAVAAAERAAWDVIGHKVNLGSPKQLQAVLFDELDMPKTRRTKSGYTTDAEALAGLYERTQHPFLEYLFQHRDQIKLRQSVDGLIAAIGDDGRIHTTYQQTIAGTGRLSSTDPNLQNIPIRTEMGRRIRTAFVPGDGFTALMSADYSQIEMRLMADLSGDEGMIEAFRSGRDFHAEMAAKVFHVEPSAVTGEMRARIKAMNYGLAYGLSAYGLSNQLGISVSEAKELMADYFERVGNVHAYLEGIVDEARRKGYTQTMLGRRRYLTDLGSSDRQRREMAERAALNSPIQGSAADVIKLAMLAVDEALTEAGLRSRVLLQVHDELVFEVAEGEERQLRTLVADAMSQAVDLTVPLAVSIGVGDTWESAAH